MFVVDPAVRSQHFSKNSVSFSRSTRISEELWEGAYGFSLKGSYWDKLFLFTQKRRVLLHGETQALMLAHTKTVRSFPWFLYFVSSYRTSCHLALHWDLEKSIAFGSPLTYDISLKQVNTFSFPKIRLSKIRSPLRCYDNGMGTRKKSRWVLIVKKVKYLKGLFFVARNEYSNRSPRFW